ncbi:hypothetical protein CDD80_3397 [Ophiocordyceps camponoti-rufipedis]|uniref:Fatty acid hydroxylase domain-containing protein n=1 Tax=Ophiocordyceps camponoti-rufipedis TaxID=2004952 RepID=A0A2C5ZDH6_9HYPO|nr:hypothetical protein CDD80_3397 [Ophiocordyceps camponoti-rufipedis]
MSTRLSSLEGFWFYLLANYDPFSIKIFGLVMVDVVAWWIPCFVFASLEYMAPSFAARHKMQATEKSPTLRKLCRCIMVALANTSLGAVQYTALNHLFSTKAYPAGNRFDARLPSFSRFAGEFLMSFALREILFYWGHRALHWRPLYKSIHRIHHEFSAPVAFASKYAHPVEFLTSDALPIMLPPFLLRTHMVSTFAFTAGTLFTSTVIHSGYDFFYRAAWMHDRHHEGANAYFGAFGALGLIDWAHGTVEKDRR